MRRTCGGGNILGLECHCCWEISYYFGADFILEKVAGFSPLWFPQGKFFVSLVSCDVLVFDCCTCYSLSKDPNIMLD